MIPELQKQLFFSMLRIRLVEEKVAELYPEQEMRCPVHLSIGQEAIASGVCATLYPTDAVFSNHRVPTYYLAVGGNLKAFLAEMYGKVTGCCQGKGGSMHLIDLDAGFMGSAPIVGGTIPVAVGVALGAVMQGLNKVVVVFFGEATTEEGVFHESANFASLKNLPVVFVCENNFYSVYTGMSDRQPLGREVYALAKSHNIPSFQGDGNDVAEVYQMTTEAVQRARNGGGPLFWSSKLIGGGNIVDPNYDNDLGYRTEAEFQEWKVRCPIQRTQAQLLDQGILTAEDLEEMTRTISSEIEEAVSFAKTSPFPDPQMLFQHIYA